MKIIVNNEVIAEVVTNRSLTIYEAMYCAGYDITDQKDCARGYNNNIAGFYIDDMGSYCFDTDAAYMQY